MLGDKQGGHCHIPGLQTTVSFHSDIELSPLPIKPTATKNTMKHILTMQLHITLNPCSPLINVKDNCFLKGFVTMVSLPRDMKRLQCLRTQTSVDQWSLASSETFITVYRHHILLDLHKKKFTYKNTTFIDREAREIIHLVASVCLSVHLSVRLRTF